MILESSNVRTGHLKGHLKGFTLIELLVVIAIIGILSSVVLASLYIGRLKAMDAAIKSDLHTIQNQMELYFSDNNGYGPTINQTSAQTTIPGVGSSAYITDAVINGALGKSSTQTTGSSWAVAIKLKADAGNWWCLDSTGSPKVEPDSVMSGTALGGGNTTAAGCP